MPFSLHFVSRACSTDRLNENLTKQNNCVSNITICLCYGSYRGYVNLFAAIHSQTLDIFKSSVQIFGFAQQCSGSSSHQ